MSGSKRSIVDDELLDWVIREEGFIEKPRNIGDGKITLGSGLTDPKWHRLYRQRGNKWSKEDNRTAVREELEKRKKWAEDTIPNWDSLPEHSQKAMLSYKYNFDFTPKNSPLLFQAMTDGRFIDAMYQMDATSKDPKFKKGLEKRRKREQEWGLTELLEQPKRNPFEGYLEEFPDMVFVNNPYKIGTNNRIPKPVVIPIASDNYVEAVSLPDERPNIDALRAISQIGDIMHFNESMKWENQPQPTHFVSTNQPDYVAHSEGGSLNKKTWDNLSLTEKSEMMRVAIENGITNLSDIKKKYNEFAEGGEIEEIVEKVNSSKAPFVQRLKDPDRKYIRDWAYKNMIATHKLGVGTDEQGNHYIYPEVQEINGKLVDFTRPPYASWVGQAAAEERGDTVRVPSIEDGLLFTENYKKYYPKGKTFAEGSDLESNPKNNTSPDMDWHQWWLNNRIRQLGQNVMETESHPIWWLQEKLGLGFPGYSAIGKEEAQRQINNAKQFTEYVGGNNVPKDLYHRMSRGYSNIEDMSQDEFFNRHGSIGITYPSLQTIVYPGKSSAELAKTHERTHAMGSMPQRKKILNLLKKHYDLGNLNSYTDDPDEVYSRLMDFRKNYNIDPKKKITKKDLETWRKVGYGTESLLSPGQDIIDRYDDDFLLELFNDVAYVPSKEVLKSNITALGGPIRLLSRG